jgi:hypothetical protein
MVMNKKYPVPCMTSIELSQPSLAVFPPTDHLRFRSETREFSPWKKGGDPLNKSPHFRRLWHPVLQTVGFVAEGPQ